MKNLCILIFLLLIFSIPAQSQIFYNANVDLTLSKSQEDAHYFYNGIHSTKTDWRVGISKITTLLGAHLTNNLTLTSQLALKRDSDLSLDRFLVEQLNVQWQAPKSATIISIGRVVHPFGSFYQKQLSPDLTFLETPLSYGYYTNVSDRIGYMEGLGENGFAIDSQREWGQSINYRYGYLTGVLVQHTTENEKLQYDLAIGNNSLIGEELFAAPQKWQMIGRLGWQANWSSQFGLSMRYAVFKDKDEINQPELEDINLTQWQVALDYKLGVGQFEFSGEVKTSVYKIPEYIADSGFRLEGMGVELDNYSAFSFYNDIKYEPTLLPGSYLAVRLETVRFGNNLDHNVYRYSFVGGYKINRFTLLRVQYSFQDVSSKSWEQDFFKAVLTLHI